MPEVLQTTVSLGLDCNKRKIRCLAYMLWRWGVMQEGTLTCQSPHISEEVWPTARGNTSRAPFDERFCGFEGKNRLDEHLIWNDSHFQVRQMVQHHREDIPLTGSISPLGRKRFFFLVYIESVGWALTVLYTMRIKNVCRQTQWLF